MKDKELIESILKILGEETKKLKKKKKQLVAMPMLTRPMASFFSMDAAVSESLQENTGLAIKPVTRKFDHLKWSLNMQQKQFLDDFITIPGNSLKESDYNYASKLTGIPVTNIKSIKNTYGPSATPPPTFEDLKRYHEKTVGGVLGDVNAQFTDVRNVKPDSTGKTWSMNPNPEFRGKSFKEMQYNAEMQGDNLQRAGRRELPTYLYEWLMYFIEGSGKVKIKNSSLLDESFSRISEKIKFISFSIQIPINESGVAAYDLMTNKHLPELKEFESLLKQFNETFGTNFEIEHQFTDKDGALKVIVENQQNMLDGEIKNMKKIDMTHTDERRFAEYEMMRSALED